MYLLDETFPGKELYKLNALELLSKVIMTSSSYNKICEYEIITHFRT